MTKTLKYILYKEDKYYVSQCLNVDVSSFGNTVQEAIDNLNEALQLYFEDKDALFTITPIEETMMGETRIHV
jgi:predicted RNase H-like HicB family nuclease